MKTKIFVAFLGFVIGILVSFALDYYNNQKFDKILQQMERLENNVARLRVIEKKVITKDDLDKELQKYVSKKKIREIVKLGFRSGGNWNSRKNEEDKLTKKYGVKKKTIYWQIDDFLVPIAIAFYSPRKEEQGKDPWLVKTFHLDYRVQVVKEMNNNTPRYTAIVKVKPSHIKGWENRWATIPLDEKHTEIIVKNENKDRFRFFSPKGSLHIAYDFKTRLFYPIVGMNFANFGDFENPKLKFLSPVVIYKNKKPSFGLSIIDWNPHIGFLHDTYLGIIIDKDKSILLSLSTNL